MRIHFIKTGIWAYTKQMEEKEIYYGKDIFNWEMSNDYIKSMTCEKYIKRFYQSFEGLAFSLLQEDKFFYSNPKYHVYDLYTQFLDVTKVSRYIPQRLEISKIMMVVLSKEEERAEIGLPLLPYDLS